VLKSVQLHNELAILERESAQLSFFATRRNETPAACRENAQVYDLASVLRGKPGQIEQQISKNLEATFGPIPSGHLQSIYVPTTALARDLSIATGVGSELVQTSVAKSLVEVLRPRCTVINAGATVLEGLRSNVTIARQATTVAPNWVAENATSAAGAQDFTWDLAGTLSAKRAQSSVIYSNTLLEQSSVAIAEVVLKDIADGLAIALDSACIQGLGAASALFHLIPKQS
jgi:HK97 family phage major capsid protein